MQSKLSKSSILFLHMRNIYKNCFAQKKNNLLSEFSTSFKKNKELSWHSSGIQSSIQLLNLVLKSHSEKIIDSFVMFVVAGSVNIKNVLMLRKQVKVLTLDIRFKNYAKDFQGLKISCCVVRHDIFLSKLRHHRISSVYSCQQILVKSF